MPQDQRVSAKAVAERAELQRRDAQWSAYRKTYSVADRLYPYLSNEVRAAREQQENSRRKK